MVKKPPEPLTKEEVDSILAEAKENDPFDYLVLRTLRKSGRRLGELYGVKKAGGWKFGVQAKDFNFKNNSFETYVLKRKQYRKKLAFLDRTTMKIIEEWILKHSLGPEDYIFRIKSYRQIQRLPDYYAKKAGISKRVMCHSFRHFFITFCREQGMNYEDIRKLTGHALIATLQTYDHSDIWSIERKARKIVDEV